MDVGRKDSSDSCIRMNTTDIKKGGPLTLEPLKFAVGGEVGRETRAV